MRVRYLDGVTSAEHLADLDIGPTGLRIHYVDMAGSLQEAYWPADTLAPTQVESGRPVYLHRTGQPGARVRFDTVQDFAHVTAAYPQRSLVSGRRHAGQFTEGGQTTGRALGLLGLGVAALALALYLVFEYLGGAVALLTPRSWDEKAGKAIYEQMETRRDVREDTALSVEAQRFYDGIGFKTHFPIRIHVTRTDDVNAFALPGGQLIVNEGLIEEARSADELAGVLAHEIGHVEKRHTFQQLARMGAVYLVISALVGDVSGVVAVMVDNGATIFSLTYNRRMEQEADAFAVQQMLSRRLDPKGLYGFLGQMQKEEKRRKLDEIPDFLKTHPATERRIADIKADIPARYAIDTARQAKLAGLFAKLKAAAATSARTDRR